MVILSPKNLKLGEIWRSVFEKTGNFRQKFGSVSAFGDFSSKTKRLGGGQEWCFVFWKWVRGSESLLLIDTRVDLKILCLFSEVYPLPTNCALFSDIGVVPHKFSESMLF